MNKKLIGLISFLFLFLSGISTDSFLNRANAFSPIVSVRDITYKSATINISGLDTTIYSYNLNLSSTLGPSISKPVDVKADGTAVVYVTDLSQKTLYTIGMDYYSSQKVILSSISKFTTITGPTPKITIFSPVQGSIGETITVEGENFKDINGVLFGSIPVLSSELSLVNENKLTIKVPPKAVTSNIVIKAIAGDVTSTTRFIVIPTPKIVAFSPIEGIVGDTIMVETENLRGVDSVWFGSVKVPDEGFKVSEDGITLTVPPSAVTSKITIKTTAGDATSKDSFRVVQAPEITSIDPMSGKAGDTVTIIGKNFGDFTDYVKFNNGEPTKMESSTPTKIEVKVPVGATGGKITVMNWHNLSITSKDDFIISNTVLGKVGINVDEAKITATTAKIIASGNVTSGDYHFSVYDEEGYPDNRSKFQYASGPTTYTVPVDKSYASIEVEMSGLKPSSRYVGVMYKDKYDEVSEVHFKTKVGSIDNLLGIKVLSTTSTSVELEVSGLTDGRKYQIELINNKDVIPNTPYKGSKIEFPYVQDLNPTPIEIKSFSGLVPDNNYIAILYEDGKNVGRVTFIAKVATAAAATSKAKSIYDGGIVPECNTGDIDPVTKQYKNPCNFTFLMTLINNIIKFLLFTIATPLIALIVMYTGYLYITAGGDTGKTEKVRHILFNAVIGYVVALAAWLIVKTILSSLNVDPGIETFLK
ncbi:MAG: IPT/TIG domain-containing protein [Candidatus Paceibacterota bacterium]